MSEPLKDLRLLINWADGTQMVATSAQGDHKVLQVTAYVGPNPTHARFKRQLANEKLFYWTVVPNLEEQFAMFSRDFEEATQKVRLVASTLQETGLVQAVPGAEGVCITTRESNYIVGDSIVITSTEADLIENGFEEFMWQVMSKVLVEIHRIFITYLVDLYGEIAHKKPEIMKGSKKQMGLNVVISAHQEGALLDTVVRKLQSYLTHGSFEDLCTEFDSIGLPLVGPECPNGPQLQDQCVLIASLRNLIEHNNGLVNTIFLEKHKNLKLQKGAQIAIGGEQIQAALSIVEIVARDINERAVAKFSLGQTQ